MFFSSVDGPNGLRFNASLANDVAGSPAQSQTDRLQQTINPSKAVFTIEPNTSKVSLCFCYKINKIFCCVYMLQKIAVLGWAFS